MSPYQLGLFPAHSSSSPLLLLSLACCRLTPLHTSHFSIPFAYRPFPAAVARGNTRDCHHYYFPKRNMEVVKVAAARGEEVPEVEEGSSTFLRRTRKVVEHVVLFQMKEDLTEVQEKDMLDNLYTLQYLMRGIIAVALGPISHDNRDGCTHALFARFPSMEALREYYNHPIRMKIANEYIIPYYHGLICVDYEAEVVDDIVPIFRRGEDFEQGVEHIIFVAVKEGISPETIQEIFKSLSGLIEALGSLVVQHTSGANFSRCNQGYTHGMVTRFPSEEAKTIFMEHPSYIKIMEKELPPISKKILSVGFSIEAVGTTVL